MTGQLSLELVERIDNVTWEVGGLNEVNDLLARAHYLGPVSGGRLIFAGYDKFGGVVAAQVYRHPTSRHLPADGTWLELSRWCLTAEAGPNAGSRQHRAAVALVRRRFPNVTTFVSYSDPGAGHTGALYRACNYLWAPTWMRLRPPPSGHGEWTAGAPQGVKDRWVYPVRRDCRRGTYLAVGDSSALRHWARIAPPLERRLALASPGPDLRAVAAELQAAA